MNRHAYIPESTRKKNKKFIVVATTLFLLILLAMMISMNTGHIKLTPIEVVRTLFGFGTEKQDLVLFEFRLPRIVLSALVGMGLAVSGCILQGISRNALADPGILGINAGAGLAVMLFISFFSSPVAAPPYLLPFFALIGAGIAAILIYTLSYKRGEGISPTRLLLTGVAVAAGISALMLVLTLRLSPENYQFVAIWMAGSVWGADWTYVLALLPWLIVLIPFTISKATLLNTLNLGEMTAVGLGASIEKERRILLAAAVVLAGVSVSVSGSIGFVGLVGPHLARQLIGSQHQYVLPISALLGGLLVVVADTIGRWIMQPTEIPVGIVVAVIGAPYFLYLLARSKA